MIVAHAFAILYTTGTRKIYAHMFTDALIFAPIPLTFPTSP